MKWIRIKAGERYAEEEPKLQIRKRYVGPFKWTAWFGDTCLGGGRRFRDAQFFAEAWYNERRKNLAA